MIQLGEYNTLKVLRDTSAGLFLGDEEANHILLPGKYIQPEMVIGEQVKVFVYNDSEDRPVATTETPYIKLNEFARLQVNMVTGHGAFLDWGLEKDLLVPFREQGRKMAEGRWYMVYMYLDKDTNRLVATAKVQRYLNNEELTVNEGQEVDALIWEKSDLGYNVIINQKHTGLIYGSELFEELVLGKTHKAYITKIREDNKIDITLRKPGVGGIIDNADRLLDMLKSGSGSLPLTDKSSPEEIAVRVEMSKKAFKKAIGTLYKKKLVRLEEDGIYLI